MNPFRTDIVNLVKYTGSGDRRGVRRYPISLKLRWKFSRRKRLLESGTGTTLDLSSAGILFESDQQIPANGSVELSIAWPILLHNTLPMQLIITGPVIRISGCLVAVAIQQHEFRTARHVNGAATGNGLNGASGSRLQ